MLIVKKEAFWAIRQALKIEKDPKRCLSYESIEGIFGGRVVSRGDIVEIPVGDELEPVKRGLVLGVQLSYENLAGNTLVVIPEQSLEDHLQTPYSHLSVLSRIPQGFVVGEAKILSRGRRTRKDNPLFENARRIRRIALNKTRR